MISLTIECSLQEFEIKYINVPPIFTAPHNCSAQSRLSSLTLLLHMVVLSFSLQKLEFLQYGEFTQTPPPYFIDLSRLLGSTKVATDDIFDWIEV